MLESKNHLSETRFPIRLTCFWDEEVFIEEFQLREVKKGIEVMIFWFILSPSFITKF